MKFLITMKDPEGIHGSLLFAARTCKEIDSGSTIEERRKIAEAKMVKLKKLAEKWFRDLEYLTVEIDVDSETIKIRDLK